MIDYHKQYSIMVCAVSEALDVLQLMPENFQAIRILRKALTEAEELSISEMKDSQ